MTGPRTTVTVRVNLRTDSLGIDDGDDHHVVMGIDCLEKADDVLLTRGVTRIEEWHEEYPSEFIAGAAWFGTTLGEVGR